MKHYIKYFALPMIAAAGLLTSCELTEDNPSAGDATLSSYLVWKGLQSYSYSTLYDQLYSASDWMFASEGGTDLWNAAGNGTGYPSDLNYESYSPANNSTQKLWKQCYSMITNCNTVINEAGNISDASEHADDIKVLVAETKVLRAFYNFLLVSNFGPVTLNLGSSAALTGNVELYPKRSSEADFYESIFKDLKDAAPDLKVTPYENNRARVTKKTAIGLLARAYAQRAGLTRFGDSDKYWKLAAETAEDLIENAATYGAYLYTNIADMWADANNRNNREALFIAAGPDGYSDAYNASSKNCKLLAYSCGGVYTDLFPTENNCTPSQVSDKVQNPTKNNTCCFYGRLNSQSWYPSYYLIYCFNPEWDRRWEYSFLYAYSAYSIDGGQFDSNAKAIKAHNGQIVLSEDLCTSYGIDLSHKDEIIYPYVHCDQVMSTYASVQYLPKVWPKGETSGDKTTLLTVAPSSAQIDAPGYSGSTKAYAVPYPVATDDNRFNTVFVHSASDADKAASRYMTVVLSDLYSPVDQLPYGNVEKGSAGAYPPNVGNGQTSAKAAPSLIKFNWDFDGVWTGNFQIKTGDMFIMRMAEVYLLAAEAEQMLGNGAKAAGYLNTLRERAARPGVAESTWKLSTVDEDGIFDEYARELCGEFTRWALLKRHNAFESRLAKYNVRAAKSFQSYMYNRPVSSDFLQQILNSDEYGDNGYGQTPTSGLENVYNGK